jgi:hypothetical protein
VAQVSSAPPYREGATKLLISCDVGPGGHMRLDAVANQIESLAGHSWRYMDTCWLFLTEIRAVGVRDALKRVAAMVRRSSVAMRAFIRHCIRSHVHNAMFGFQLVRASERDLGAAAGGGVSGRAAF